MESEMPPPLKDALPITESELLQMPLVARATVFAAWMHRKQKRKYGCGEYIRHPMTVATTVGSLGIGAEGFAAALLHDTVEDTAATLEQVERLFGAAVRGWVEELTNEEFENKAARMEFFRGKVPKLSLTATQIKLADRLSNLSDCGAAGEPFITRYTAEALVIIAAVAADKKSDPIVAALTARIHARVAELATQIAGR